MNNAKEMFEKIGYNDQGNRNDECELFVYEKTVTKNNGFEFRQETHSIIISCDSSVIKIVDKTGEKLPISYLEIQAIHQQMKELGWLE